MNPCGYRGQQRSDGKFNCRNETDLIHNGWVSERTCEMCPYAKTPDFWFQTQQLLQHKQRTGEYAPVAKSCGGCGETKHRDDSPVMQFVWPYWEGGANGDELRWSIRSVETLFQGRAKITIIGDKPDWYHGHVIRKKRVPKTKPNRAFRDMLSKVFFIATHEEIDQECVWMMDDIYFLKPFTVDDLKTPRATHWRPSQGNSWQRRKVVSMTALQQRGLTQHDYATHLPHHIEKQKLRTLFDDFNLHSSTMLWEVLYGNVYRETPISPRPFFVRLTQRHTDGDFAKLTANATVLNHMASVWSAGLRAFLNDLLPAPASVEGQAGTSRPGYMIRKKAKRMVKRRPLETHRAYRQASTTDDSVAGADIPHIMLIQASYADHELSRRRLEIARHTSISSLAYQTRKPIVHIAGNPNDPHSNERLNAYRETGCDVRAVYRTEWKLYGENWELPEGRKVVSRMDDDDVIAKDFCERTLAAAPATGEHALIWPNGYVFWREQIHALTHPGNQFISLVTDQQTDPHQRPHWRYHKRWSTLIVSNDVGWIWVRHGDAATSTLEQYRSSLRRRIDSSRIPINLRGILRAIEPSGQPSGSYSEHENAAMNHIIREQQHAFSSDEIRS